MDPPYDLVHGVPTKFRFINRTAGPPQYGQLWHGTNNVAFGCYFMYNSKDSSVKLVYEPQPGPQAISTIAGETIVRVACGTNHTVAVDKNGFVYTLGHREQKDEWVPYNGGIEELESKTPVAKQTTKKPTILNLREWPRDHGKCLKKL
ncbi:hypothetical protein K1719_015790 [Acacia pycnantha]|nr:hypothetical protein K1719_015790 [Acacia pycnantha]